MGKINIGRVVLGGLLAGVVLNIGEFVLNVALLEEQWKAAMESLNRAQVGDAAIVWFNVWGLVMGIAIVWTYAAMRPRFGAGPKTAIIVGLAVWFMVWVLGFGSSIIIGLYPTNLVLISLVWGLFEVPIATVTGAWLYKEE